jgi:hypothetical protein
MGRAVDVVLEKVEKLTKPMCKERSLELQTLIDGVCGQLIDMFPDSLDASRATPLSPRVRWRFHLNPRAELL